MPVSFNGMFLNVWGLGSRGTESAGSFLEVQGTCNLALPSEGVRSGVRGVAFGIQVFSNLIYLRGGYKFTTTPTQTPGRIQEVDPP